MVNIDVVKLNDLDLKLKLEPTVVSFSRLEPVNLTTGDLAPGLEVRVADPLWMVGRQWQFEELRGEDGGSPILAEVSAEHAPVTRFHPGPPLDADPAAAAVDMPGPDLPLEVAVEAETPNVLPERVRAQQGLHLLRMTRAALPKTIAAKVAKAYLKLYPFPADPAIDVDADPEGAARRRLLAGRVPDGAAAITKLAEHRGPNGRVRSLPKDLRDAAATTARQTTLKELLTGWLQWAEQLIATPIGTSWDAARLEYSFAMQATLSTGQVVLRADEYVGGTVDWYTFDAAAKPWLGMSATGGGATQVNAQLMPTPVKYAGMPSDRLWAFEDAKVYLGDLRAGATDMARLALVEFSLAFGTDWFLLPLSLPYGHVARVHKLVVVDTFGKQIPITPSRDASHPGWTVFQNTPVTDRSALVDVFVLPATLRHIQEGPPLEEVALFRDEMANLVWGVERIVQGPSGEPVRRGLVESRSLLQQLPDDLEDASIVYRLMTPVPEHWVPFVSVRVSNRPNHQFATELERRPMVRFLPNGSKEVVHPHGVLLRADPDGDVETDRLRIPEEEVPREGVVIARRFQLARTPDGGAVLWVGRRKQAGQGEGAAGLKFDTALPPGGL